MKNTHKIILGSAFAIAIIGGAYVNRPRIEVTAEATAYATSSVIVPTSTKTIVTPTTTADVATSAPQITYVYKETVREVQAPVKPVEVIGSAGSMIDNAPVTAPVPTPVFTTPTIIVNPTPVYVQPTPVQPAPIQPTVQPVVEPVIEPIEVKPTFTEWPRAWVEARNNGDWLFFEGKWETGELGVIKCNGVYYDKSVQSGFYKVIQVAGSKMSEEPPGTYFTCDFTVGDLGGTTLNYVTK